MRCSKCQSSCGAHGTCDTETGLCTCKPTWKGATCQVRDPLANLDGALDDIPPAPPRIDHSTVKVEIIWGVLGLDRSSAASLDPFSIDKGTVKFDPAFDLSDPSAQVALQQTCEVAVNDATLVQQRVKRCFIADFATWAAARGGFPVPASIFIARLQEYLSGAGATYHTDVAFSADRSRVQYARVYFKTHVVEPAPGFSLYPEYLRWERFVEDRNAVAPASASNAFQTSPVWVTMMTEIAVVNGLIRSIVVATVFSLVCVLIFIGSCRIAALCTSVVGAIVTCTFGVLSFSGWTLGAIEAICITMLVGLSVDYTVHLADSFIHNGIHEHLHGHVSRADRLIAAMGHVGTPVLHSAITTAGAAAVLMLCQIQLLVQVGIIISLNASIGVLVSLLSLAALLSACGPEDFTESASFYSRSMRILTALLIVVMTLLVMELTVQGVD